jgi:hypothetical protein
MNTVIRMPRRALADPEALVIGRLYKKSLSDLIAAGKKLSEKKDSLAHGQWLAWLDANAEALGFGRWTAQRLMKIAVKYADVAGHAFAVEETTRITRELWGHTNRVTPRLAAISENIPSRAPTDYDQQLERLRRAWGLAGTEARQEFLTIVREQW